MLVCFRPYELQNTATAALLTLVMSELLPLLSLRVQCTTGLFTMNKERTSIFFDGAPPLRNDNCDIWSTWAQP